MRQITGYQDGKPLWSDNVPAEAPRVVRYGALVTGSPGAVEAARIARRAKRAAGDAQGVKG